MRVTTIEDYEDLPKGSCIQKVVEANGYYCGIWNSPEGSYAVKVPVRLCKIWPDEISFLQHFYGIKL